MTSSSDRAAGRCRAPLSGRSLAWLSLDAGDNDPVRFWRQIAAALHIVRPGTAQRLTSLLDTPGLSLEAVVTALVNDLVAAGEVVLVLRAGELRLPGRRRLRCCARRPGGPAGRRRSDLARALSAALADCRQILAADGPRSSPPGYPGCTRPVS